MTNLPPNLVLTMNVSLKKLGIPVCAFRSRFMFTSPAQASAFPNPPLLTELVTEQDNTEAEAWLARFGGPETKIPRKLVELTFSRSSGPGGQVC